MAERELDYILKRGVSEIIIEQELVRLLKSGRRLRLKMGFDPSRPDIHLGHVVGMRKLRQFQELGHQVVLIIGDWTAQIGDPSGESQTRPMLSAEEVRANAETYMRQFFKVVDREKTELRWQSEWFGKFNLAEVISLTAKFTVAQLLAREDFSKRYTAGRPIALTELLYPLLQAYDSVAIEADVEFGGIDQKFNCLMGRELQQMMGQRPQQILLMPLLVGTKGGQKMSKSLDNYIAIEDPPHEMYGKVMSISDSPMMDYFKLLTDVPDLELEELHRQLHPKVLKKRLAREIVSQFHGAKAAQEAEAEFERVHERREEPEEYFYYYNVVQTGPVYSGAKPVYKAAAIEVTPPPYKPIETAQPVYKASTTAIAKTVGVSGSEAKRLLLQGAIEHNGNVVTSNEVSIRVGDVFRVGKRRWVKIVNSDTADS